MNILKEINDKWNTIEYIVDDDDDDRWQIPQETWARGKGDCEDIAIGKFFDIPAEYDPYICYVMHPSLSTPHMIVTARIHGLIVVLDNLDKDILPLGETRYEIVYKFNTVDMIVSTLVADANQIQKWVTVKQRMKAYEETANVEEYPVKHIPAISFTDIK